MNIYTLHQAGSFRPPSLDPVDEVLPHPSSGQNTNLHVVTTEKRAHGSTSITSGTSGSGSGSEKTTPRHNTNTTNTNTRAGVSRIDATGEITNTNRISRTKSKETPSTEMKKMVKPPKIPNSMAKRTKHIGLIHIQAKDEFMIFEDNTDLVSHITTPSAVRTSPLESEFLVIDHDEFAEEEDLFSAITVPKALRRKKNKNKRRSKSKNADTRRIDGKENVVSAEKKEGNESSSTNHEQRDLKLAPSTSSGDSVNQEKRDDAQEMAPSTPVVVRRQNSLELATVSRKLSEHSGSSRSPHLRGGKRGQKSAVESVGSVTSKSKQEEKVFTFEDDQNKDIRSEGGNSNSSGHKGKEEDEKSQQKPKKELDKEEISKQPPSVLTAASSNPPQVTSEPSPAISQPDTIGATPEKMLVVEQPENSHYDENDVQRKLHDIQSPKSSLANKEDLDATSSSEKRKDPNTTSSPPRRKDPDSGMKKIGKEGSYPLDITATTARLDATHIAASISRSNSNESSDLGRKLPNSAKKTQRLSKFSCLFCHQSKKKREQMEEEQQSAPFTTKSALSADFNGSGTTNQE